MTKRILIFGTTGTVGSGALFECLDHPEITEVIGAPFKSEIWPFNSSRDSKAA
ncbi:MULTISPECIES: hypothetical protein [Sulfitobacter]|jgi:hypothetical protein|uniref:1-deoxy-D-xylulose 5-phosphate reductoisomerase N-terminal domain-containing protein n=1 Tax=Sulfitobacter dubius TaxID=218673 RepID=A0ABY3ZP04_9RHOB|nr:hypothetical protein [Sulfitobacter dubius]UOA15849.1 hypothetical protein DSM109990_02693 [Sulfitobacter dubius]WOI28762.1 hypothetical protein R1T39_13905 [Sulfitobacter dubius]